MVHCTFGKRHTELSFEVQETSRSSLKPRDQGSFEHELAMRKKKKKTRKFKLFANFMGTLKKNRLKTRGEKKLVHITQRIGMKAKKFSKI